LMTSIGFPWMGLGVIGELLHPADLPIPGLFLTEAPGPSVVHILMPAGLAGLAVDAVAPGRRVWIRRLLGVVSLLVVLDLLFIFFLSTFIADAPGISLIASLRPGFYLAFVGAILMIVGRRPERMRRPVEEIAPLPVVGAGLILYSTAFAWFRQPSDFFVREATVHAHEISAPFMLFRVPIPIPTVSQLLVPIGLAALVALWTQGTWTNALRRSLGAITIILTGLTLLYTYQNSDLLSDGESGLLGLTRTGPWLAILGGLGLAIPVGRKPRQLEEGAPAVPA
jgi:hypothetical protein